jgi:hypothetical protein
VLFTELLEQAQDGKRADSGFKKEAWDSVLHRRFKGSIHSVSNSVL